MEGRLRVEVGVFVVENRVGSLLLRFIFLIYRGWAEVVISLGLGFWRLFMFGELKFGFL